ncbi:MAG: isoamylase [Halieaceae bacterium]
MNFALYSAHAEAVELCLYDAHGEREIARIALPGRHADVWHGFVPGLRAGMCYGYRVRGPYAPWLGHRFNHHKLLLDPYARALRGTYRPHESHLGYSNPANDIFPSESDNAAFLPKGMVCETLDPAGPGPAIEWADTRIYELHLRGFTMRHPAVPDADRGRIAGLSCTAISDYLKALGITCVELLPIHAFIDEPFLMERGLSNYWGYNTLSYFAPHSAYLGKDAGADAPRAMQAMVNRLHDAGLEVILDVVYNHSCETDELGPTLSLRGIDNASYYRLETGAPARYVNDTGCGNTLATQHPAVRKLVLDSLRYWAGSVGIDGFRFDLGTVLARGDHGFDPHAGILTQLQADPLLSQRKLIAEPWDIGPDGYRLGGFPAPWAEWNDRYRDSLRRFWRGDDGELPELARRLHGSGEIFEQADRKPWAGINFISSHDGFTLRDLVSYKQRHNQANQEHNRDGHGENYSDNCGVEGPSENPEIRERRRQQVRNLLASLLLSQGVPMLQAGDETGRTQQGNNNAYCQDNSSSWLDWKQADTTLQDFVAALLSLRAAAPLLRADRFRHQKPDADGQSLRWVSTDGAEPEQDFWHDPRYGTIGCLLVQDARPAIPAHSLLILLNNRSEAVDFSLPSVGASWSAHVDTATAPWIAPACAIADTRVTLAARSLQLLAAGNAFPGLQRPIACEN